jgi:hypothetical protein
MWLEATSLAAFVKGTYWAWPAIENVHFLGLALLVGMVGLFDLRMLGMAKTVSPAALHRKFVPVGIVGFLLCLISGVIFFVASPGLYIYNPAFYLKIGFIVLAGLNVLIFYLTTFPQVESLGLEDEMPLRARVIAIISLLLWISVICFGRLLPFV